MKLRLQDGCQLPVGVPNVARQIAWIGKASLTVPIYKKKIIRLKLG